MRPGRDRAIAVRIPVEEKILISLDARRRMQNDLRATQVEITRLKCLKCGVRTLQNTICSEEHRFMEANGAASEALLPSIRHAADNAEPSARQPNLSAVIVGILRGLNSDTQIHDGASSSTADRSLVSWRGV